MPIAIPDTLQREHAAFRERLQQASAEPGPVGEHAREVARLLRPHLAREEEFALPPLGLLADIARDGVTGAMRAVLPMTRKLAAELPLMLAEHRSIVAALDRLVIAAREAGEERHERLAIALMEHALMEEKVFYPAALLVGERVESAIGHPAVFVEGVAGVGHATY